MDLDDQNISRIENQCEPCEPVCDLDKAIEVPTEPLKGESIDATTVYTTNGKKFTDDIDWWPDESAMTTQTVNYIDLDDPEGTDESKVGGGSSSGTEDTDPSSSSDEEVEAPAARVARKQSSDSSMTEIVIVGDDLTNGNCDDDNEVRVIEPTRRSTPPKSSSSCESSSSDEPDDLATPLNRVVKKGFDAKLPLPRTRPPRTRGEILLKDLPAIESLSLEVSGSTELRNLGSVSAIVDHLVVIQSSVGSPSLDSDTILFKEDRSPLGQVFDIFGPVSSPYYSIRFNSEQHAIDSGVKAGMKVFYAPSDEQLSKYVFLEQLRNEKGSDASWKHDNEPPARFLDYSDDETEKRERRKLRSGQPVTDHNPDDASPEGAAPKVRKKAAARRSRQNAGGHMNSQPCEQNSYPTDRGLKSQSPVFVGDWRNHPPPTMGGNWPRFVPPNSRWPSSYPPPITSSHNTQFNPQQMQVPAFNPAVPPPNYYSCYSNHSHNETSQSGPQHPHAAEGNKPYCESMMHRPEASDSRDSPQSNDAQYKHLYEYYMNYYTNYYDTHMQSSSKQGNE